MPIALIREFPSLCTYVNSFNQGISLSVQEGEFARNVNTSLAFFIHDAFSLMDRGFVFTLIRTYLKKVGSVWGYGRVGGWVFTLAWLALGSLKLFDSH